MQNRFIVALTNPFLYPIKIPIYDYDIGQQQKKNNNKKIVSQKDVKIER